MDDDGKLHDKLLALNEALLLGSLRQHALTDAAERLNVQLRAEIVERKRVEAELTEAKAVAEKANRAKSEFLSSMSHELRTPLNAILGFAQLMETDSPPPTASQKASIGQIVMAGWYLLDLINEILDLALVESGKLSLAMAPVPLGEVLSECEAEITPLAKARAVDLEIPAGEIRHVVADPTRLKQVLINLLSNGIKYNKTGGVVSVHCVANAPGRVRIGVQDTGNGLSPEDLAQLLQRFNRLEAVAPAMAGTGIGLAMCRRLVELMGGAFGAESTVGAGSLFWVELNLAKDY